MKTCPEPARTLPLLADVDVAVFGGGVAGVAAAVSAARAGARTALVERFGFCGGLATGGLIAYYWVLDDGRGRTIVKDNLNREILHRLDRLKALWVHPVWRGRKSAAQRAAVRQVPTFDPELFKLLADRLLTESGVQVYYHCFAGDPLMSGRRIKAVAVETKAGRMALKAKVFVDATGDADLAWRAGAPCFSREQEKMTAWFRAAGPDANKAANPQADGFCRHLPIIATEQHGSIIEQAAPSFNPLTANGLTQWEIAARESIYDKLCRMKKQLGEVYIANTPTHPNVRRTRRILGKYQLGRKDLGVKFDDSIGIQGLWTVPGEVYDIPYRCLPAPGLNNLLTAGRCISTTEDGWEITRIISACVTTGAAAGAAAALAAKSGGPVTEVDPAEIRKLMV